MTRNDGFENFLLPAQGIVNNKIAHLYRVSN